MSATLYSRPAVSRLAVLAVVGLSALAGGCRHLLDDDDVAADLNDPVKRHPVAYAAEPEVLMVEMGPDGDGLSANQQADVYRFVKRYKAESTGSLKLEAPRGAGDHLVIRRSAQQVEEIVRGQGIDPSAVASSRYVPDRGGLPALRLSYDRVVAVAPQCADWATDLGENRERLTYNNFGCATQRNFALNVANARDILTPQQEAPRSGEARSAAWSKYLGTDKAAEDPTGAGTAPGAPPALGGPPKP